MGGKRILQTLLTALMVHPRSLAIWRHRGHGDRLRNDSSPSATSGAEPLNLRLGGPPTLSISGSDTCILYSPDAPYGRTCHRCTCHPGAGPWDENQGLKHNRNIELYLLFLTSGVSRIEGFLGAFCLR